MPHLKKNKVIDGGQKVARKGLERGVSTAATAIGGPIGWVLSLFGKKLVGRKLMPLVKAKAIKAKAKYETVMSHKKYKEVQNFRGTKEEILKKRNSLSGRKKK